jgi:hypothetical protein
VGRALIGTTALQATSSVFSTAVPKKSEFAKTPSPLMNER